MHVCMCPCMYTCVIYIAPFQRQQSVVEFLWSRNPRNGDSHSVTDRVDNARLKITVSLWSVLSWSKRKGVYRIALASSADRNCFVWLSAFRMAGPISRNSTRSLDHRHRNSPQKKGAWMEGGLRPRDEAKKGGWNQCRTEGRWTREGIEGRNDEVIKRRSVKGKGRRWEGGAGEWRSERQGRRDEVRKGRLK